MAKQKTASNQWPEHAGACKKTKALFGLLILLVGLYGIAGDMGMLGAKPPVSPWWILVFLVGLIVLLKASAGSKCPVSRMR